MYIVSQVLLIIESTASTVEKLFKVISTSQKYKLLTVIDLTLFLAAISTAIGFSNGFDMVAEEIWLSRQFVTLELAFKVGLFWYCGVYQQVLRYSGREFVFAVVKAIVISSSVMIVISNLSFSYSLSSSILINDGILTLLLTVGFRLMVRSMLDQIQQIIHPTQDTYRLFIYGAGCAGCLLAKTLAGAGGERLVGFVDDNPELQGRNIEGTRVYSPDELIKLKDSNSFDAIVLAMPSIEGERKREILLQLQTLGVPIETVPSIAEILSGQVSVSKIREVDIEDLLGRKPIAPNPKLLRQDLTDRVVLVTGAGGSIGSELCRQIATQQPRTLVLYELHEFALYRLERELTAAYPELNIISCLGSVTDGNAFTLSLNQYRVETIYHAAAYKHVPIVEANPVAGMLNNIGGTLTAAECAIACKVDKFVLISTDKAVRPTNIMGATKRVAELILQGLAGRSNHQTCFTMVRFGNVLGSSGSVVPLFREQLAAGKPLTVTHPDITRYFMTIPEAATLVIQAGAMAKGGEVFLLEMGEPIKIYDLAVQMIGLSGMVLDRDVKIEITGLRPGEKIYEELLIDCDAANPTEHPKIFCAHEAKFSWKYLFPQLNKLMNAAAESDVKGCIAVIHDLVPEYQPTGEYARVVQEVGST